MTYEPSKFAVNALTLLIVLLGALFVGCEPRRTGKLGNYGIVQPFELTDSSGQILRSDDLKGRILVVDFFFAGCSAQCLSLSTKMSQVQRQAPTNVILLSLTVDPASDTPAALRQYAKHFNAETNRWLFLTGKKEDLYRVIQKSFLQPVAGSEDSLDVAPGSFLHSEQIVLVDAKGVIRGYYDGMSGDAVERILAGINELSREQGIPPK
jgi:protein SCO1/2